MSQIRTFVAIPLPQEVQALLGQVSEVWAERLPQKAVRWVKPHLMHATLRFLGDTDSETVSTVSNTLDEVTAHHSTFTLELAAPGCFPNDKRPRVIWVGLQGQLESARALKREIDQALVPLGWDLEDRSRSFRPHLTLGRVKDSRQVKGFQWEAVIQQLPIQVSAIHFIESKLQRTGPIYTVRHVSKLRP